MTNAVNSECAASSGKNGRQSGALRWPRLRPEVLRVMTGIMMRWRITTPTRTGCAKNPATLPQPITISRRNSSTLSGMPTSCLQGGRERGVMSASGARGGTPGPTGRPAGPRSARLLGRHRRRRIAVEGVHHDLPLAAHLLEDRHVLADVLHRLPLRVHHLHRVAAD